MGSVQSWMPLHRLPPRALFQYGSATHTEQINRHVHSAVVRTSGNRRRALCDKPSLTILGENRLAARWLLSALKALPKSPQWSSAQCLRTNSSCKVCLLIQDVPDTRTSSSFPQWAFQLFLQAIKHRRILLFGFSARTELRLRLLEN